MVGIVYIELIQFNTLSLLLQSFTYKLFITDAAYLVLSFICIYILPYTVYIELIQFNRSSLLLQSFTLTVYITDAAYSVLSLQRRR